MRQVIGVESVYLFGHSWDGVVAQHFAALYPERVRSLVLLGSEPPAREGTLMCQDAILLRVINGDARMKAERGRLAAERINRCQREHVP